MASNPPPSGPGQPWPGVPSDTPATGHPTGGVPPQAQWPPPAQQPPNQWAPQPAGQWGQAPQQPGQWPPRPQQPVPPQGQWGQQPPAGQQPQGQWGQQPQGQWGQQPPTGQQPQGQWGQQGQWPPPPPPGQPPQAQWGPQGGQWPPPAAPSQWPTVQQPGWGDPAAAPWGSDYPVDIRFTPEARIGRLWGIPLLGFAVRILLLIPHFIVLAFYGLLVWLATWITWIPVLLTGRYPSWGYAIVGGYLRWTVRVTSWAYMMSGTYPPFSGAPNDEQHVWVRIDEDRPIGRFWGIPIVGIAIRAIILIPHFIVLWLLSILVALLLWFAWLPVLINGRQADLVYNVVGGYLRWVNRVSAYLLLLSGPYPPFRLD